MSNLSIEVSPRGDSVTVMRGGNRWVASLVTPFIPGRPKAVGAIVEGDEVLVQLTTGGVAVFTLPNAYGVAARFKEIRK